MNAQEGQPAHYKVSQPAPAPAPAAAGAAPAQAAVPEFFGVKFDIGDRYQIQRSVGKGAFGVVVAALDKKTNDIVAVKKISKVFDNNVSAKRVLRELKLLRLMHHENLISILDIPSAKSKNDLDCIYIVNEYMDTDLHTVIQSAQSLGERYLQFFLFQILRGVAYMHACNVLHRDMKPTNILVKKNCDLKICDFGLARVDKEINMEEEKDVFMTEHVVTRWYRAPEVILSWGRYTKAIDIWSVGCILAELMGRAPVFPGKNYINQLELITDMLGKPTEEEIQMFENEKARKFMRGLPQKRKVPFEQLYPLHSAQALDLLSKMLVFDPRKRITAEEALKHPYLKHLHREDAQKQPTPIKKLYFSFEEEQHLDKEKLRDLIWEEICTFHQEKASAAHDLMGQLKLSSEPASAEDENADPSKKAAQKQASENSKEESGKVPADKHEDDVADDDSKPPQTVKAASPANHGQGFSQPQAKEEERRALQQVRRFVVAQPQSQQSVQPVAQRAVQALEDKPTNCTHPKHTPPNSTSLSLPPPPRPPPLPLPNAQCPLSLTQAHAPPPPWLLSLPDVPPTKPPLPVLCTKALLPTPLLSPPIPLVALTLVTYLQARSPIVAGLSSPRVEEQCTWAMRRRRRRRGRLLRPSHALSLAV